METGHTQSQLLTPSEVRAALRVSSTTVRELRRAGRLVGVRTDGGHYRYSPTSPALLDLARQLAAIR